jgi:hypothetical protein
MACLQLSSNITLTIQYQIANHLCNSKVASSIDQLHQLQTLNNQGKNKIDKIINMAIFHQERVLDRFPIVEATLKARARVVSKL